MRKGRDGEEKNWNGMENNGEQDLGLKCSAWKVFGLVLKKVCFERFWFRRFVFKNQKDSGL